MRIGRSILLVLALLFAGACSSSPDASDVDFGNNVQLKERITEMTYKGDCPGLLKEYQAANAIPDQNLMVYIDEHADEAGCFPEGSLHFGSSS